VIRGLVTIGITCFNAEDTIARAIAGALAQTWMPLEVLIVDDCSGDGSVQVIENAISARPDAKLIRHSVNSGPAGARNTVLQHANGEFVSFFDDDDESLPDRVTAQVERLIAYEQTVGHRLVLCYASGERQYANGYRMDLPAIGSRGEIPHGPELADYLLYFRRRPNWFYGTAVPTCALLARTETLLRVGGFDNSLRRVEDNDIAIRLALLGAHFVGVAHKLFIQHSTSAPDKSPRKNLEAEHAIVRKHRQYLAKAGRYYYALHWHNLRYWHFTRQYGRLGVELLGLLMRHPVATTRHFLTTGPRRLVHEWRMRRSS
jgi:glycosyltransferase involved in cell wall biosynthesis